MIVSVSWRNIWRSKLRSMVILIAIALGIFAGVFNWAFYQGMGDQRIETAINTEVSHLQFHLPEYLEEPDAKHFIKNADEILNSLSRDPDVSGASKRMLIQAMATSAETGTGVLLMGIEPEKEQEVTNLYTKLVDGKYLEGIKRNPIVIGQKLAEKLNLKIRSKLVITLQMADGEITREQFRVAGIYKTSNTLYDQVNAFVRYSDLLRMTKYDSGTAHEIAVLLNDNQLAQMKADELNASYSEVEVRSWRTLLPEVSMIEESMNLYMMIFMGIIMFALCFGIINTMLMAILERVKELGMLMAIGMSRTRVFIMIVIETLLLSLTGAAIGIVLGVLTSIVLTKRGLDLAKFSEGAELMGYDSIVYPVMSVEIVANVTIMVIIAGVLASIFPAYKAIRLKPAEAIRSE